MIRAVETLSLLPLPLLWGVLLGVCVTAIALLQRFFGKTGLYAYMGVAMIAANIQVVKLIAIPFYDANIPMGTTLFASIFLCNDLINERYGRNAALKGIALSFVLYGLFALLMITTLAFIPAASAPEPHAALWTLFAPSGALWVASITAYLASQYYDTWVFSTVARLSHQKALWLRASLSLVIASLIDNALFSWLAWRVLAPEPVSWSVLFWTYIWGTFGIRCALALVSIPILYGLVKIAPPAESAP